jgi:hypothetical protein
MYQSHTHLRHKLLDSSNHPFPLSHASIHALPMDGITQTLSEDTSLNITEMKSHISVMSILEADRGRMWRRAIW